MLAQQQAAHSGERRVVVVRDDDNQTSVHGHLGTDWAVRHFESPRTLRTGYDWLQHFQSALGVRGLQSTESADWSSRIPPAADSIFCRDEMRQGNCFARAAFWVQLRVPTIRLLQRAAHLTFLSSSEKFSLPKQTFHWILRPLYPCDETLRGNRDG